MNPCAHCGATTPDEVKKFCASIDHNYREHAPCAPVHQPATVLILVALMATLIVIWLVISATAQQPKNGSICKITDGPPARFGVFTNGHCNPVPGGHLINPTDVGKTADDGPRPLPLPGASQQKK